MTFARPPLNIFTIAMMREVDAALTEVMGMRDVVAVVRQVEGLNILHHCHRAGREFHDADGDWRRCHSRSACRFRAATATGSVETLSFRIFSNTTS